jgi:hypothetical protein
MTATETGLGTTMRAAVVADNGSGRAEDDLWKDGGLVEQRGRRLEIGQFCKR